MKTKIQLTYCGMLGTGPTVKEAKQDAARKIEAFLAADHEPKIVSWGGDTCIVWQTPHGVVSSYLRAGSSKLAGTCHHGHTDIDKALQDARLNLAQNFADIESDDIPAIIRDDVYATMEFLSWLGFQRAFRHARSIGTPENDCHAWACNHGREFRPVTA